MEGRLGEVRERVSLHTGSCSRADPRSVYFGFPTEPGREAALEHLLNEQVQE